MCAPAHCQGLSVLTNLLIIDHTQQPESSNIDYFRVRQKVPALCYQAEEDLKEFKDYGTSDKGTDTNRVAWRDGALPGADTHHLNLEL